MTTPPRSLILRVTTEDSQEFEIVLRQSDLGDYWYSAVIRKIGLRGFDGRREFAVPFTGRNAAVAAAMAELLDWAEEGTT